MGGKRVGDLKTRVGWERCIGRRGSTWTTLNSGGVKTRKAKRRKHSVGKCDTSRSSRDVARRIAPGVKASKSFESRAGE